MSLIGQRIGKYEILEIIGQGGMATVYKAYQPDMERHVAIKLMPLRLSEDPTFLRRFQREARVIANLEHRAILPVYDYGEHDGMPYIVMRLVGTGTLRKKMYYEDIEFQATANILEQVAEALDHAHSKSVIHRDLKPSNILLDAHDNAYLTDFGIAKLLGGGTSHMTDGSGVIGTPSYMSPEQCQGKDLGPPSDIYALGCILYEMVTGAPPYIADTPLTVMYMHVKDPVPSARAENPDLPAAVDKVFYRVLAKKPQDRYRTASELSRDFRRAIESGSSSAYQPAAVPPYSSETPSPTPPSGSGAPRPGQFEPSNSIPAPPPVSVSSAPFDDAIPPGEVEEVQGEFYFGEEESQGHIEDSPDEYSRGYEHAYGAAPVHEPTEPVISKTPRRQSGVTTVLASLAGIAVLIASIGGILLVFSGNTQNSGVGPTLPPNQFSAATPATPTTFLVVVITNTPTQDGSLIQSTNTPQGDDDDDTVASLPPPTNTPPIPQVAENRDTPTPTATLIPTGTTRVDPTNTPTATRTPTNTPTNTPTQETPTPDGDGKLAFTGGGGSGAEIISMDVDGSGRRQLTNNNYYDAEPDWSPNGSQLVFESNPANNWDLYIISSDGSNRRQLTNSPEQDRHADWSPVGNVIVFESGEGDASEIFTINADGTGLTQLTDNDFGDRAPRFSSDGSEIAYMTNQRGSWEVAIMDASTGEQLSIFDCPALDCRFPAWSPNASEIVFNTLDRVNGQPVEDEIWILTVSSGQSREIISGDDNGRAVWSDDGYIYFNKTPAGGNTVIYQYNLASEDLIAVTGSSSTSYGPDWVD